MTITNKLQKTISSKDYFSHVVIPETWATVEEFADWYLESKMPMMIPWNASVICTDDATAMCLFRKGEYQVELYLVHPQQFVPRHEHPNVEVVTMFLSGGETSRNTPACAYGVGEQWGMMAPKLEEGEAHGGLTSTIDKGGFALLAFQRWPDGVKPSSAAVQWRGETAGPKQERLIREAYPTSYIQPGWADISGQPITNEGTT